MIGPNPLKSGDSRRGMDELRSFLWPVGVDGRERERRKVSTCERSEGEGNGDS